MAIQKKKARAIKKASTRRLDRRHIGFTVTAAEERAIARKAERLTGGNVSELARHAIAAFSKRVK